MSDPKADPSALLARFIDDIEADEIIVVDPPSLSAARSLLMATQRSLRFFCHDFATHQALDGFGLLSEFGAWLPSERADGVAIFLPKGRDFAAMVLAKFSSWLDDAAPLWLVGPKRGGILTARQALEEGAVVDAVESGKHCKLIRAAAIDAPAVCLDDYVDEWGFELNDVQVRVCSFPGVFGHGRLDAGTSLLLRTVIALKAPFVDVGSGCGAIGAYYGLRGSSGVLLETNAIALEASRRTLRANKLTDVSVVPSDGLKQLEGSIQSIVANPPFHKGFETDYDVTRTLVRGANAKLRDGGTVTLVCNSHLKIGDQLNEEFGWHDVLADDRRYRVYRVEK
ncbi:MAG: 16S rRNA (guanine1207-N2)-methyltransferase [Bradymonadia bacterium]|jgi:16S rRNA (guanine1207-N2)-methyltransferase